MNINSSLEKKYRNEIKTLVLKFTQLKVLIDISEIDD